MKIREWDEVVHSGQNRRTSPTGHGLHGWDGPDHRERSRMPRALGMRVLVARGRISLLLVRGRGRRHLLHTSFRTRARIGHVRWDYSRDRDPRTLGQRSPS